MTTRLGNLRASLWSILRSMLRICISFFVRCISPFCARSPKVSSTLESDGDAIVAATSAAMAAGSTFGERLLESAPPESPLSLSPRLARALMRKRPCDTRSVTALRPPDADSRRSCAVFPCPPGVLRSFRNSEVCAETAFRPSDADSNKS